MSGAPFTIRKAVIPIGGLGSRMFPVTGVVAKAFLPIVNPDGFVRPFLHHLLADVLAPSTGIERVCIVISDYQRAMIETYFCLCQSTVWDPYVAKGGKWLAMVDEIRYIGTRIELATQHVPRGFGDAVLHARHFVGDDAFFVLLLGDHLYTTCDPAGRSALRQTLDGFAAAGGRTPLTSVGTTPLASAPVSGILGGAGLDRATGLFALSGMAEKPSVDSARARWLPGPEFGLAADALLCNFGIDILPRGVFDLLASQGPTASGECELRVGQADLLARGPMLGLLVAGERHDTGLPREYGDALAALAHTPVPRVHPPVPAAAAAAAVAVAGAPGADTGQWSSIALANGEHFPPAELALIRDTLAHEPHAGRMFDAGARIFVARAPGRLDVMGGIADYSGSLVLQLPLAQATLALVQLAPEAGTPVESTPGNAGAHGIYLCSLVVGSAAAAPDAPAARVFRTPLESITFATSYGELRALFAGAGEGAPPRWPAYVCGFLAVLAHERGVRLTRGLSALLLSSVPQGKGLASSASVEVAFATALCAALAVPLTAAELARLCQIVENTVVGAPCGIMDQLTAAAGARARLLPILCRPDVLRPPIALPAGLALVGVDSGVRHSVGSSHYGVVRAAAFMGLALARAHLQQPLGCLTALSLAVFDEALAPALPEHMSGAEFVAIEARVGPHVDAATTLEPNTRYPVREAARHPIAEHERVRLFGALLATLGGDASVAAADGDERLVLLGELMYDSHASYTRVGLGSPATDAIVQRVRAAGPAAGLYGAKITGGGQGGTVAVLLRDAPDAHDALRRALDGLEGVRLVDAGSSPGAFEAGIATVLLTK